MNDNVQQEGVEGSMGSMSLLSSLSKGSVSSAANSQLYQYDGQMLNQSIKSYNEEEKETYAVQMQKKLINENSYIPNMPRLVDMSRIQDHEVYDILDTTPISIYKGHGIENIADHCTVYEARRYLAELILLNEKNKSSLIVVDESSIDHSSHMSKYFGLYSNQSHYGLSQKH